MPDPANHYFSADPTAKSAPRQVELMVDERPVTMTTDTGVFSGRDLDPGTRVLLNSDLPSPSSGGTVLDLGCGWGPIAVTMADRLPDSVVWAVDVNSRALALTAANAAAAELSNIRAELPEAVPSALRFAAIYSNPPIRIGKAALHELLQSWLSRLTPDGFACLVVARNLGADSLARWLVEIGYDVSKLRAQKGFRVLLVRPVHSR